VGEDRRNETSDAGATQWHERRNRNEEKRVERVGERRAHSPTEDVSNEIR